MTIEEKRQMIGQYCDTHCCGECTLYALPQGEPCFDEGADIERNFAMLFPNVKDTPTSSAVDHPSHYNHEGAMECIDEMVLVFGKEAVMAFCLCNAWKYRYRAGDKNGEEDLKKADWYLAKFKELKGGDIL